MNKWDTEGVLFKPLRQGFTLAEVLITLGIIGVVAALTIPTLVQNQRNKELQVQLKKSYAVINEALNMYQAENGIRTTSSNTGTHKLKPILMQYLKVALDCGDAYYVTGSPCSISHNTDNSYRVYKTLDGINIDVTKFDDGQFVLQDGTFIMLENNVSHLFVSVDLNGYERMPDRLGYDLFMFEINEEGTLLPMGAEGTTYYSDNDEFCSSLSSSNMNGAGCTYKALNDPKYFENLK